MNRRWFMGLLGAVPVAAALKVKLALPPPRTYSWAVGTVSNWTVGIDNSDADCFKLSYSDGAPYKDYKVS